jgi:hypothetical protein
MSNIEARGAKGGDSSDWNHAWDLVSQLAAARGTTLREHGTRQASTSSIGLDQGSSSTMILSTPFAPVAPDQLARDIAEIERAAAALRRTEPSLEPRAPEPQAGSEPQTSRSIWPLVCVVWLTALAVVSCTIGAIVLLVR